MTEFLGQAQSRGAIDFALDRRPAAHRRRRAGELLVAIVGVLVPQAVGGDAEIGLGDAEFLHHVAQPRQVLLEALAGPAQARAPGGHQTLGRFQRGSLLRRIDGDESLATALGAAFDLELPVDLGRVRNAHHGLLRAHVEPERHEQLAADVGIEGAHLGDLRFGIHVVRGPALVTHRRVGARDQSGIVDVVRRRLHHARMADPLGEGAQVREIELDRSRLEPAVHPAPDHEANLPIGEIARPHLHLLFFVGAKLAEEREVEVLPVLPRLVRDVLVLDRVFAVEVGENLRELVAPRQFVARQHVLQVLVHGRLRFSAGSGRVRQRRASPRRLSLPVEDASALPFR